MRYGSRLTEGRLVRRYKRFLADVRLSSGPVVVAHCANPGRMTTCAVEGGAVWVERHDDPRRKLEYTWELAAVGRTMVCVNTLRANQVVDEALAARRITELERYTDRRREVRVGGSRIDFMLSGGRRRDCYVEVKMVTLAQSTTVAAFPDSVTARGTRHLQELIELRRRGHRAVLLFCCLRAGVRRIVPADSIDPAYGAALRRAASSGVEVLGYGGRVTTAELSIRHPLPVDLS